MKRAALVVVAVLLAALNTSAKPKFVPSADGRPFGTYRVTLAADTAGDAEEVVERLLQMCRCRRQPFAELGFHGFVVTATESSARLISIDPRVVSVEAVSEETPSRAMPAAVETPKPAHALSETAVTKAPALAPAALASTRPPTRPAPDADAVPWSTGAYTYDGSGNIVSIGGDLYRYDRYGRVTRADAEGHTKTFTYDRYGNIKSITTDGNAAAAIQLYPSAATNQLTNAPGSSAYTDYDGAGRMEEMGEATFAYDGLDTVVASKIDSVQRVHLYTASDERIATFAVVGGTVAGSDWTLRDPSGKVLRRLTRSATGQWKWAEDYVYRDGQLLASEVPTSERTLHYHLDHLGTPRLITNHAGAKVAYHAYHAFGLEATNPAQDAQRLKYTGHERDASSLDYMHARYYTPVWGRFLSVDPVISKAAIRAPQMWNRYSYVANNPVNRIDPDGRLLQALAGDAGSAEDAFKRLQRLVGDDAAKYLKLNVKTGIVTLSGISRLAYGVRFGKTAGMVANLITTQGHTATFALSNSAFAKSGGGGRTEPTATGTRTEIGPGLIPKTAGGVAQNVETTFAHELGHAFQDMYGLKPGAPGFGRMDQRYLVNPHEAFGMWSENNYRGEAGLPHRSYYWYGPTADFGNDYIEP